jgi:hypothetical protein
MRTDALQTLRTFLMKVLLGASISAGTILTWGAAWVGLTTALQATICCHSKIPTAMKRVKAARDAAMQYMIDNLSCPQDVGELVAGKYLDRGNAKDPWGSELVLTCPGTNDASGVDVSSPGPDRQLGSFDDIKSWELPAPRVSEALTGNGAIELRWSPHTP